MSRAILSVLLQIGFALPLLGQPYWLAASGDIFRCNIVWREYQPAIMPALPWAQELDYNLMHREGLTNGPASRLQKQSGRDEHSIVADAQFVDPAQGDYRVKDGSPALSLSLSRFCQLPDGPFWCAKTSLESSRAHASAARPKADQLIVMTLL